MIYIFRGKAATGKTSCANLVGNALKIDVISKDYIFDNLLTEGLEWDKANSISYDKLIDIINTKIDSSTDCIVDVGLAYTPYYIDFVDKIKKNQNTISSYNFICSVESIWINRIEERINNPGGPNQAFESSLQAKEYYNNYDNSLIKNEIEVDSALPIMEIVNFIINSIKTAV